MKKLRFQSIKSMNEKGENVCVVSLVQLNGGYIISIEQSRTAERFKEDFSLSTIQNQIFTSTIIRPV